TMTGTLGLATCFSTVRGQPRLGDELVASPLVWRAFRPLVWAVGAGDPKQAVSYLRASSTLLRKADGPIERDAATETFQTRALASIGDFDLREFFALLPDRDGPFRFFAFEGTPLERGYRFQRGKGSFEVAASSARRGFGDASGVVRMRHAEADDKFRYLLQARAGVGVGPLSWHELVAGVADLLALVEERTEYVALPLLLQTADSHLKRSQPALHEEDRRVLAALWGSFPEVSRLLTSVSSTDDVIVAAGEASGVTQLRVVTRWDVQKLSRDYPHLAEFFRDLGNLIEGKLRLVDRDGNLLLELFFDSEHMRSRVEAFVRGGQLVPSRSGKPLLAQAPHYEHMRAHVDLHMQQFGLHMYLDDLTLELSTEQHESGASLAVQIKQTPRFRARGAAFGVFPAGMLDWFIPGDIEGLARKMMDVTMMGNDGRGVTLNARIERPQGALATIDGSVGLEILDTALIRFGMKIAADRVMPDDAQTRDIARLTLAYRDAFSADVERFAKYGKLASAP
ncbi:MAG: hypothetical protein JWN04_4783, partial [Myxococcaceae bacterium]|nr:hypothetical protein [Myxococcaceae bacterium]